MPANYEAPAVRPGGLPSGRCGGGSTVTPSFSVRALALAQIRELYAQRLVVDFPPDELKPLSIIERALRRGEYVCYGAMDGQEALAYGFFVKLEADGKRFALFDYFAVRQDLRDRGVGSRFLLALVDGPLRGMDCVLLEIDAPERAGTPEERRIRDRRLRFYLNNGLRDTTVSAVVYGVEYRILSLPVGGFPSPEETRRLYAALYRAILPERAYKTMVKLL